jgi:hypothetical protein
VIEEEKNAIVESNIDSDLNARAPEILIQENSTSTVSIR